MGDGKTDSNGLDGLRVIEVVGGFSASSAGKLFADLGAEVILVEPPEGSWLRRHGSAAEPVGTSLDDTKFGSGAFLHLSANKRSITLDLDQPDGRDRFDALVAEADLVITEASAVEQERWGLGYARLRGVNAAVVVLSITPFGLSGPYANYAANELTVMHASGWGYIMPGRGSPDILPPIRPFGHHAYIQAGLHGACVALGYCLQSRAGGTGAGIDYSMQHGIVFILGRHLSSYTYMGKVDHRSDVSLYEPMSFYPCRDGELFIICPESHQWERMLELMGDPDRAREGDYRSREGRGEHAAEIRERVAQWTRSHGVEGLFHLLQRSKVGAAPVFQFSDLTAQEQLQSREYFQRIEQPGVGELEHLGPPYKLDQPWWRIRSPAPALDSEASTAFESKPSTPRGGRSSDRPSNALPLRGIKVLDLSWVWAGPHCSLILAALGAEVWKIESSGRMDLTRRASIFPSGMEPGPNRCGYFNQINQFKRSVGVNLRDPEGIEIVRALGKRADVMVANFGTGVLERLGLGPAAMREENPDLVVALISAFGQDGPLAPYTGYGPLISPLGGVSAQTGYAEDDRPRDVNMAYGDPNGGVYAAYGVLASLYARAAHGSPGQVVDVSMWESMLCTNFEGWINHALGNAPYRRDGNHDPYCAPYNVYRCLGEDAWVAIGVESESEWTALCSALGQPALAKDPRFASMMARKTNEVAIDEILQGWCAERDRWEVVRVMQAVGVAAMPSLSSADLMENEQLSARGAFERPSHPEVGEMAVTAVPWQVSGAAALSAGQAPCLAEGTDSVLSAELSFDSETLQALRSRGIIE